MKFVISLLIVCSLQHALVQSKTIDDVLEDFRPAFEELYGVLNTLTRTLYVTVEQKIAAFDKDAFFEDHRHQKLLSGAYEINYRSVENILRELDLVGQEDVISDCIEKKNMVFNPVIANASKGFSIALNMCRTSKKIIRNAADVFGQLQSDRRVQIEETKSKCKANSTTPYEMQTCLINDIYYTHKPALVELEKDMHKTLEDVENIISTDFESISTLYSIIITGVENSLLYVLSEFKTCCYEVVGKN